MPGSGSSRGRRTGRGRLEVCARAGLLLLGASLCADAAAVETQFHGFAAQGFVLTDHYDFFGDSRDGKASYYEVGAIAAVQPRPELSASAEVLLRDAGTADSGKPRLSFALVDYRFLSSPTFNVGVRAGRVKNPLGFYNDTRDFVFTRPGILLPQSVYNETQGLPKLLFSSDGGQLYGDWSVGGHLLSLVTTVATDRELDDGETRLLVALPPRFAFDLEITRLWNAMLTDQFGKWRFALSHTSIGFRMDSTNSRRVEGDFDVTLSVASVAWEGEKWTFVAEYSPATNRVDARVGPQSFRSKGEPDGGYLQAQYRLTPHWTLLARYDLTFAERSDRSGREFAAATGEPRHLNFGRDLTLGASWKSDRHWGVWGEVHITDGTVSVQALENEDDASHRWWTMFMLMAAYRF